MRKLGGLLLTLICAAALCAPWYPRVTAPHVGNAFEAAALLLETPDGVTFREEEIDADSVYRALEAQYPYAFSLHATTRSNRTTELRIELSRPARQEQAREYAVALAAETVTDGMTDAECFDLLATDGMLVKRPLLVGDDFVIPGFKEEMWAEALGLDR